MVWIGRSELRIPLGRVIVSGISGVRPSLFGSILDLRLIYVVQFLCVYWGEYQQNEGYLAHISNCGALGGRV